jgi:hypothetical protein
MNGRGIDRWNEEKDQSTERMKEGLIDGMR